jgi:hypothetical protein
MRHPRRAARVGRHADTQEQRLCRSPPSNPAGLCRDQASHPCRSATRRTLLGPMRVLARARGDADVTPVPPVAPRTGAERRAKPRGPARTRNGSREPVAERIYLSACHPEFEKVLKRFVYPRVLTDLRPEWLSQPLGLLRYDHRQLLELVERLDNRPQDTKGREKLILELIAEAGPDVLRPPPQRGCPERIPFERPEDRRLRIRLRQAVWERLTERYATSRNRLDSGSDDAAAFLKRVGAALAGDRRGRRQRAPHPPALRAFYYVALFKLRQARELLQWQPCSCHRDEKIRLVADACGLPEPDLREHVLSASGKPKRSITPEEQARIWTAREFDVAQQTVSNALLVRPSRK